MKLIIDVPEEVYEALKGIAEDTTSLDPYSLADIIVNKSKPYEERPALNNISESDKQKLIEAIRKSRLQVIDSSAECPWIPVTYRPMTEEEEKELCEKLGINGGFLEDWEKKVFTCQLPDDGQEILISSFGRYVIEDICSWDEYGCGLENNGDWDGVDAWMPKPEPYKKPEQLGGEENE